MIETHGKESITCYIGNPTAHNFSLGRYVGLFIGLAALPVVYSAGTVDQWPKNLTAALMYGGMWSIPTPDVPRTDHWIIMGGNPQASQGSLLACADILGELDGIRARGGKVVVIDPRRTGTADRADEWVPIVPGTDAAFLLAMVQRAVRRGPRRPRRRRRARRRRRRRSARVAAEFPPERVEATCRIPADTHPAHHARVRRRADGRALRPHRHVQPGVRHARLVARRRREHPHRQLRPARAG